MTGSTPPPDHTTGADWLVGAQLRPETGGHLAPLYDAAERGDLALPHCADCTQPLELDQLRCDACGSADIAWLVVEPSGTVHSVTIVHRREPGLIVAEDPYPVLDIELRSGHRLLMTTTAPVRDSPTIGEPVRIGFRSVAGVAVPAAEMASSGVPHSEEPR